MAMAVFIRIAVVEKLQPFQDIFAIREPILESAALVGLFHV
jgi:hypothetical protein